MNTSTISYQNQASIPSNQKIPIKRCDTDNSNTSQKMKKLEKNEVSQCDYEVDYMNSGRKHNNKTNTESKKRNS